MKRIVEVILVGMVLACTQIKPTTTLTGEWRFVGYGDRRVDQTWKYDYAAINERINFKENNLFSGRAAVNAYNSDFKATVSQPILASLGGGTVKIGALVSTKVSGNETQNKAERRFLDHLAGVDNYSISASQAEQTLTLSSANKNEYLYFVRR